MTTAALIVLLLLAAFLVGCLVMRGEGAANATPAVRPVTDVRADATIDPNDDHQLGLLLHMTGGAVNDAAAARNALQRFEREHGRRATTRDVDAVVGLIHAKY